jgi:hypothetical protein
MRRSAHDFRLEPCKLAPLIDAWALDEIEFWCLNLYVIGL